MAKISSFMISIVIVSFIVTSLGLFAADLGTNYNNNYDNTTLQAYNQLEAISETAEEIQEGTTNIKEKTGVLDIIGNYFSNAYKALILTVQSFDLFDAMRNDAIDKANLGAAGSILRVSISAILLILIFVGVILSAILKYKV